MPFTPLLASTSSGSRARERLVLERREKARIRRTLERYVSHNVVREIIDNPASYRDALGG